MNSSLEGGPGEAELANHVADLAGAAGADIEMYDVEPGRPNLLAWIRRGNRPTLMFECHLDTVGLDPMPDALNPRVANGRLYGRGSADPKGCMAAMLHVLQAAADDPDFPVDICLAGAVGEEIVMIGSRVMAERRPPVDAAVVGEPTELRIITAQKGAVSWRVRTHGVAAHSAMPEQGHNAIEDMAEAIPAIARGIEPHLNDRTHPILGNATWNVGTIRGGAGVNVVPDRCEIEIDRRLVPGDTSDEVLAHVDAALDELRASDPELRIDRDPPFVDIPPLETPEEAPVVRAAQQAVAAAGISPEPLGVAYATDAAMLSGLGGIPSVVLGPGNIAQAHTNDEWIELAQLEQVVGIYLGICRAFAEIAA
ncbi:MAG: M20/M25/M40 family metallo-hydrolase [Chloroflexota bacterium]|nr:M20/M25/M40 family metallo-hydrolase [Chloroflexota bacterium]